MTAMQVKGIVFDLDGTLVDSLPATFKGFNHGIALCGGPPHSPQEIMAHFGAGEDRIFAKILGEEHVERAYQAFRNYLDENLHEVPLHDGVREMLDELASQKLPLSIVTGRSWNTTQVILKHHDLLDRFVTVIAHDHVPAPKPDPFGIRLALQRMNLDPSNALYVGDHAVDILAARAAGSRGVAALWDATTSREKLLPHQPHHWAEHPRELLSLLGTKGNS